MRLWLDDVRVPPVDRDGAWTWAKTADEAIAYLKTGQVVEASLDHDLAEDHYPWAPEQQKPGYTSPAKTGLDVVRFILDNPQFAPSYIHIHSMNPVGRHNMFTELQQLPARRKEYARVSKDRNAV